MEIVWSLLASACENILFDNLLQRFLEQRKLNGIIKDLNKTASSRALSFRQNEAYYNALDSYITTNNVVFSLIRICCNKLLPEFQTKEKFAYSNAHTFIESNKEHVTDLNTFVSIFEELYAIVDDALKERKLNQETQFLANTIVDSVQSESQRLEKKISDLQRTTQVHYDKLSAQIGLNHQPAINENIVKDDFLSNEIYKEFNQRIKDIIECNKCPSSFQTAINELNVIAFDIVGDIDNLSKENRQSILLYLYDTQAQYNANMGNLSGALDALERADACSAINDKDICKRHNYISAYIHTLHQSKEHYIYALRFLDKALSVDKDYHIAFFLKCKVESTLEETDYAKISHKIEQYYQAHPALSGESDFMADYYQTKGIVCKQQRDYENAVKYLQEADDNQQDIMNAFNISICYYYWALEKCQLESVAIRPEIDYPKMIASLEMMSDILSKPEQLYNDIRKDLILFYISASHFCGQFDKPVQLEKYIDFSDANYQVVRSILIEKAAAGLINESDLQKLSQEDQIVFKIVEILRNGDTDQAVAVLEGKIDDGCRTSRLYQLLLELYVDMGDINNYIRSVEEMSSIGLSDIYYDLHSALLEELRGDIQVAATLIQECMTSPLDTYIVLKIRDFYTRNDLSADLVKFYTKIHALIKNNKLRIADIENFYGFAIQFLIAENYFRACEIFSEIPRSIFDDKAYYKMALMMHSQVENHQALIQAYSALNDLEDKPEYKLGLAHSYKAICDCDNAYHVAKELLMTPSLLPEEKSKCLILLSEICLYKEDFNESYSYARQCSDNNVHIPTHPSHHILYSRAMQCNRISEGVTSILEYKRNHPIVVDWIEEISLPTSNEGELSSEVALDILIEKIGPRDIFDRLLDSYRCGSLSLYHMSRLGNTTLNRVLSWCETYKLKLRIFNGTSERLELENKLIPTTTVVDAATLLVLAKTNLLFLLDEFEQIFITSSNVEQLQIEYMDGLMINRDFSASKAYKFLEKSDNVFICPNSVETDKMAKESMLPNYLCDTLIYANGHNIPFFYGDETILRFAPSVVKELPNMFGITSMIVRYSERNPRKAYEARYELLKNNCFFVNFGYQDIYYQLQINNFDLGKSNIEPFFKCKNDYDMNSFGDVYAGLFEALINEERRQCAVDFAKYVFRFLDKTSKRSLYYAKWGIAEDTAKYKAMQDFVLYTLFLFANLLSQRGLIYAEQLETYPFEFVPRAVIEAVQKYKFSS